MRKEKWKLNFFEKQTIGEDIYNFIAFGQSNFYQNFPNTADLANIYKITYKINDLDQKLSINLGHFIFQWMMYVYLKDKNMPDLRDKVKTDIDDLSNMIIDDINRKL